MHAFLGNPEGLEFYRTEPDTASHLELSSGSTHLAFMVWS